jgi:hypothetical protein
MRKLWIAVGVLAAPLVLADLAAEAQGLNSRQTAPPGMKAKIGNALTSSRVEQAKQGDVELRKKSVHDECGPVSIGNSEAESNRRRGMAGREETVIVPGDVVTICR